MIRAPSARCRRRRGRRHRRRRRWWSGRRDGQASRRRPVQDQARHGEGADERDEEQHREQLEGPDPGAEDRLGHLRRGRRRGVEVGRRTGEEREQERGEQCGRRGAEEGAGEPLPPRRVDLGVGTDRRAGQHEREEDEHDDGADVDEQLDEADELLPEDEVGAGERTERDEQPQRGVDDLLRRHRQQRRQRRHGTDRDEDDVAGRHSLPSSSVDTVGRTCVESPCAAAWSAARSASAPSAGTTGDVCSDRGHDPRAGRPRAGPGWTPAHPGRPGGGARPTHTTRSAGCPGGPRGRGHLGGVGAAGVERRRRRDGGHPRSEPVLLVEQVADVELGVLELGAPVQGVERAHLDADAAVHAEREVDGEAVEDVALAGPAAGVVGGSSSLCESM